LPDVEVEAALVIATAFGLTVEDFSAEKKILLAYRINALIKKYYRFLTSLQYL
jgi:hypothetical protein